MIDFRYHVVSLMAVLLALAGGIVIGATALTGYGLDAGRGRTQTTAQNQRTLDGALAGLRADVARRDQFATAVAPAVVAGQLAGQRVLIVRAPGATEQAARRVTAMVEQAGGVSAGQLRLRSDLLDPTRSAVVDDLVATVAPAGLVLPAGRPTDRAATVLAAALLAGPAGATALPPDAAAKVLGGFTGANLVTVEPAPGAKPGGGAAPATLAVLLTGPADGRPLDDAARGRHAVVLSLARAMDLRSSGVVLAGPVSAAGAGGLLQSLQQDASLRDRVSSVDGVDTVYGAVNVVLALREQLAGGTGRYGTTAGAQPVAPVTPTR